MSPVFAALSNLNMAIPYIFTARFPEKESATLWLCIGNNIVSQAEYVEAALRRRFERVGPAGPQGQKGEKHYFLSFGPSLTMLDPKRPPAGLAALL